MKKESTFYWEINEDQLSSSSNLDEQGFPKIFVKILNILSFVLIPILCLAKLF